MLERDRRQKRTFSYLVLQPKDAASLEQTLNAPEQDGYVPLGYVWHVGWTVAEFLVLEKETTASPAP